MHYACAAARIYIYIYIHVPPCMGGSIVRLNMTYMYHRGSALQCIHYLLPCYTYACIYLTCFYGFWYSHPHFSYFDVLFFFVTYSIHLKPPIFALHGHMNQMCIIRRKRSSTSISCLEKVLQRSEQRHRTQD